MSAGAGSLLRLAHPAAPSVFLDGEWVVFNPVSWEVHILNPAASAVYELLAEAPRSAAEVESLLRELLVEDEQPRAAMHARRVIGDLALLGLLAGGSAAADDRL